MNKQAKDEKKKDRTISLEDYLKSLRKGIKSAQGDFWKEIRLAEEAFRKDMTAAMRDYEKVEYSNKRVPGTLAEATKSFNERYNVAYGSFGNTTKETLERFEKIIEDLIGV